MNNAKRFIDNSKEYSEFKKFLNIIGDKWSILIIICVFNEPKRYKDIEKFAEGISPRTLTQRLDKLVKAGMLERSEYKEFPPRIEYVATDKAKELRIALRELKIWSQKYCSHE